MNPLSRSLATAAVVLATFALSACGPIDSAAVIRRASVQLEAARVSDAARFAQFEYRAAEEYLHKAREEQSYSEYTEAVSLGELAYEYAERARARALGHPDHAAAKPAVPQQPPRPKPIGGSGK